MYEIIITKSDVETVLTERSWEEMKESIDKESGKVLVSRGWTPQVESEKEIKRVVFTQIIGSDDFDLQRVVAAINGLQLPVRVAK